MIPVRLRLRIHDCFAALSSSDVVMYRDIELPCAPFWGMSVTWTFTHAGEEEMIEWMTEAPPWHDDHRRRAEAGSLNYDLDAGVFTWYGTDKTRYYGTLEHVEDLTPLADLVAWWTAAGFTVEAD